ncbi:unnamed protein product, partial [Oikopleura dioica]
QRITPLIIDNYKEARWVPYHFKISDDFLFPQSLWDFIHHRNRNSSMLIFLRRIGPVIEKNPD